jgi:hypothetical protein
LTPPLAAFGWLALAELFLGAVLLGRLVFDLGRLHAAIAVCVGGFYLGFLVVTAANVLALVRGSPAAPALGRSVRFGLAFAVPVALIASTLDCMGLDFGGCTPACGFLTRAVAPAVAALVLLHAWTGGSAWVLAAAVGALALLIPNCVCRNPVNRPWIDLLGRSPACYASAFSVFLLASTTLAARQFVRPALVLAWGVVAAELAFWIGHHYFHVPW